MTVKPCERCGHDFMPQRARSRYCSRSCAGVAPNRREDIWTRIDRAGEGCWEWTGTIDTHGYGRLCIARRPMLAHRIAFELGHGVSAAGMLVCHHCDNRRCCNPAHLFLGTPADNLRDAAEKGRMPRGEACHRSKLTEPEVVEIRRLASSGIRQRDIAEMYGVTQPAIGAIHRRETWRHVA